MFDLIPPRPSTPNEKLLGRLVKEKVCCVYNNSESCVQYVYNIFTLLGAFLCYVHIR